MWVPLERQEHGHALVSESSPKLFLMAITRYIPRDAETHIVDGS